MKINFTSIMHQLLHALPFMKLSLVLNVKVFSSCESQLKLA